MRAGALALIVLGVLSLLVWWLISGTAGLWGAGIGWLVGGGFMLLTVVIVLFSSNTSPTATMGLILGSWIVKAALLLGILFFLKDKTFYDTPALTRDRYAEHAGRAGHRNPGRHPYAEALHQLASR